MNRALLLCGLVACVPPEPARPPALTPEAARPTACVDRPATASGFTDLSTRSGVQAGNFVPHPATPIPINDHSRLALVDVDGDGWDDAVMHSLFPNAQKGVPFEHLVFLNQHDGTFKDFSEQSGLKGVQAGFLAFADLDNDGYLDVFAGLDIPLAGHSSRVLLNDGRGHFTVKANAGVERLQAVSNAVFFDFNRDGKLDLFAGSGQTSYLVPNALLLGKGDGTFTDVTSNVLVGEVAAQPTNGLVACDYDNDGDQDVFAATYGVSVLGGVDQLWENQGDGRFINVAQARGFAAQATGNYFNARAGYGRGLEPGDAPYGGNSFGIDCADLDGDSDLDIYLAQISHADGSDQSRLWSDPTVLLINQGPEQGYSFVNEFLERGLPFNEGDIDAAMVDFDGDGRLDLAVTRTDKYEASFSEPAQQGSFGLFRQKDDGTFESRADLALKATQNVAFADLDHDGDADVLLGGRDQGGGRPNFLYQNDATAQWLAVTLEGDGVHVPKDAFGARVTLKTRTRTVLREKKSSRGTYGSIDGTALLFGLGQVGACEGGLNAAQLEVRWPDGRVDTLGPEAFTLSTYVKLRY